MILADVMDEIATELDTITGLRVFAYPPDDVDPPAAFTSYPESIVFDETYGRGMDRMTLTVVLVLERVEDRTNRDRISEYVSGSGASSVKEVLEAGTYTAFDTLRVVSAEFNVLEIAATKYLAALFELDIAGTGA